ncbi:MAG: family 78 glycoside hydrolase catalytic domain [Candidatus Hydrogenedentes bacterium]|nr:family 78 glycoside hydrolase catalytic domain [Candidatus Hydrogenedentota bacterium]
MSFTGKLLIAGLLFAVAGGSDAEVVWEGPWIAGEGATLPLLRKTFTVQDKAVTEATAYVCGLGHFDFFVNGAKCGDHVLDPGWTNYRKTCMYVPFDVTGLLKPGPNAVGVMLGNGMYNVTGERYTKFKGSFGEPKLILQLEIRYADGSVETVHTDDTWRSAPSPIIFSCIYGGEDYDARMEQPGWDTAGFDDAQWGGVRIVEGPGGVLREQDSPPIKVAETLRAVGVEKRAPGEYIADLGWNLSAQPVLKVSGAAGQSVTIQVSELPDGPWKGHSYTYTLKGGGEEVFRPRFTYFGFQYLFISGADLPEDASGTRPVLLEAGADFITSSARPVGAFECDHALLNDIEAMITRSVRSNLQSVLTDCPHREKLGWLEVSHLMGPSIAYHFDISGLYRKICRDTAESQLESGLVPDIAPEYTRFGGGFFESAEWGSASVQLPWFLYRWYGDEEILARQYDTMARYTRYLAGTRNEQGLARGGLGDWYDWTPEKGHAGEAQLTPIALTATAMLYDNARILARVAGLQGKGAEHEAFTALAAEVRGDFLRAYYHPQTHSVSTGSQAALACGLYFGLVPNEDRGAVLEQLVQSVESMAYRPTVGEVCFRFLVQSLAEGGRSDVLYRILDRTDPPGYGCMLRVYNLKTLSEQWDKPGSSLNHCMFGQIQEWFQGYLVGIRQVEEGAGFARLRIGPTPVGGVNAASGHFDGPRGRIEVAWTRSEDGFTLRVTVPEDTTADIVLLKAWGSAIRESGKSLQEARGIGAVLVRDTETIVTVKPGTYHFHCGAP